MPNIAAVATAVPPHRILQSEAREFARRHFQSRRRDVERLLPVFDHAGIETRYVCMPPDWYSQPRSFAEKNARYIEWATSLGADVARECLTHAGLRPEEITHVIFVSTTGLATPSIDARLINVLSLGPHVRRTPLWGLGCGGGAAGLSHAAQTARADPEARVLLVAVELCSLTFNHSDASKSNLVATALFADGAAGVLVTGDQAGEKGPAILASRATTWPGSLDVMGWNIDSVGMQVVFSRAIPSIVAEKVRGDMTGFLSSLSLTLSDVAHFVAHPGGVKVIEAYEAALNLTPESTLRTRETLRAYGNMSAPSVLFVLKRLLEDKGARQGDYGILTALGPGFTAENLLLRF